MNIAIRVGIAAIIALVSNDAEAARAAFAVAFMITAHDAAMFVKNWKLAKRRVSKTRRYMRQNA